LFPICIAGLLYIFWRRIGLSKGLFLTIVLAAGYLMFISMRFGKEITLDWRSLGLLLGIVGLIYKPIVDSLSDKDFNDFDYISLGLALVLGIALFGSVLYLVTPFDTFLRATFTLPFAGLGIALLLLPIIYIRYRGYMKSKVLKFVKNNLPLILIATIATLAFAQVSLGLAILMAIAQAFVIAIPEEPQRERNEERRNDC